MSDYVQEYERRTPKSKILYDRATKSFPGGMCHQKRFFQPYPFYSNRAIGSRLWDVDDNEYTDYWMGHFALILGHSPKPVTEALRQQIGNGTHWGTVNELQIELAQRLQRHVRCAELVRFCNTGMEATTYAIRLARAYTGKRVVLKAEGGWHGFSSELLFGIQREFEEPESLGMLPDLAKYNKTVPFNDLDGTLEIIKREDDIAALIVEPVIGSGFIPADHEFLSGLVDEADRRGFLIIFDEIITGFRLGLGGAQEYYGLTPHLATLGKVVGGGLPIGAVVGKKEVMNLADSTTGKRKSETVKIGGGTFSCNPMTMSAGIATIEHLERNNHVYERLESMGNTIRKGSEKSLRDNGIPARSTGLGSLFQINVLQAEDAQIRSPRDVGYAEDTERSGKLFLKLVNKGYFVPRLHGSVSTSHDEDQNRGFLDAIIEAAGTI